MIRSKEYQKLRVTVYYIISKSIQSCEQHNYSKNLKYNLLSLKLPIFIVWDALKSGVGQYGEHLGFLGQEGDLVFLVFLALF